MSLLWLVEIFLTRDDGTNETDQFDVKIRYKVEGEADRLKAEAIRQSFIEKTNSLFADLEAEKISQEEFAREYALIEISTLPKKADLFQVVLGWEDVFDDAGKPLKFSKANLRKALDNGQVEAAFRTGYQRCQERHLIKN